MPFDSEITSKLITALEAKVSGAPHCPFCKSTKWFVGEEYTPLYYQALDGHFRIGGDAIPAFPLCCSNCGFLAQFSTVVLAGIPVPVNNEPEPIVRADAPRVGAEVK